MSEFNPKIVKQFLNGDESSFKVIFNHFYRRIYHFILEYISNEDLAEDIVQDTFLSLWRNRHKLNDNTNINAWLYTVARNNCLKRIRDSKSKKASIASEHLFDLELEMSRKALSSLDTSELTFSEIERIIDDTLVSLSPQCRKIFEMSRFASMKNREIAEELDISVKAVEGQITKALKIFRVALKDYLPFVSYLFIG